MLARRALLVSLLVCLALTALVISRSDEQPESSPSQERTEVEQRHAERKPLEQALEAEKKSDPRVVLRLADAASATADTSLDGAGEQEAQSRGIFADQLRAAGIVPGQASQGTADARTLLATLEADRADAFWAQADVPGSPTPDELAAALGVAVDCGRSITEFSALHTAARSRGLVLLRAETDIGPRLPRMLVVRSDALVRLPNLAAVTRLVDGLAVLLLDPDSEAMLGAAERVLGDETVSMSEVPTQLRAAVRAGDLEAVAAALDARIAEIVSNYLAFTALNRAYWLGETGKHEAARRKLLSVDRRLLSEAGQRVYARAAHKLRSASSRAGKYEAVDDLLALRDSVLDHLPVRPEDGEYAHASLVWNKLAANPAATVPTLTCS